MYTGTICFTEGLIAVMANRDVRKLTSLPTTATRVYAKVASVIKLDQLKAITGSYTILEEAYELENY